jgi:hypothetical protein
MGKTFFVLKIVAVFMKCKAQPHRLYLIGTFLSQKEEGKTFFFFVFFFFFGQIFSTW